MERIDGSGWQSVGNLPARGAGRRLASHWILRLHQPTMGRKPSARPPSKEGLGTVKRVSAWEARVPVTAGGNGRWRRYVPARLPDKRPPRSGCARLGCPSKAFIKRMSDSIQMAAPSGRLGWLRAQDTRIRQPVALAVTVHIDLVSSAHLATGRQFPWNNVLSDVKALGVAAARIQRAWSQDAVRSRKCQSNPSGPHQGLADAGNVCHPYDRQQFSGNDFAIHTGCTKSTSTTNGHLLSCTVRTQQSS